MNPEIKALIEQAQEMPGWAKEFIQVAEEYLKSLPGAEN
jgi:hypothetical protein